MNARIGRAARSCLLSMAWLALAGGLAHASDAPPAAGDGEAQRARISDGRAVSKDRLKTQEQACLQYFQVQRCLDEVRSAYRAEQADLDRQQQLLDAQERRQRGAARLDRIRSKTSAGAEERARTARERAQQNQARLQEARGRRAALRPEVARAPHAAASATAAHERASAPRRGPNEQAEVQRFEAKQEQARQRQERARKRQEARDAKDARGHKAAQPLPTPASAAASR